MTNMFKLKTDPNIVVVGYNCKTPIINGRAMADISVIIANGCHSKWQTICSS